MIKAAGPNVIFLGLYAAAPFEGAAKTQAGRSKAASAKPWLAQTDAR